MHTSIHREVERKADRQKKTDDKQDLRTVPHTTSPKTFIMKETVKINSGTTTVDITRLHCSGTTTEQSVSDHLSKTDGDQHTNDRIKQPIAE